MQVIKTLGDIRQLETRNVISQSFSKLLQDDFTKKTKEAIFPDETPDPDFEIDEYGYLVLLEAGDNPADWAEHGLSSQSVFVSTSPEFAEIVEAGQRQYYRIFLYFDNDYVMQFYSEVGIQPPEIEEWFQNLTGNSLNSVAE